MMSPDSIDPALREQNGPFLLGYCAITWSILERACAAFVLQALAEKGTPFKTAQIVVANIGAREVSAIGAALAVDLELSHKVVDGLSKAFNAVQNDLRTRRNRLFHDAWDPGRDGLKRKLTTGTKLVRPQSREIKIALPHFEPVTDEFLLKFIADCSHWIDYIAEQTELVCERSPDEEHPRELQKQPTPLFHLVKKTWNRLRRGTG